MRRAAQSTLTSKNKARKAKSWGSNQVGFQSLYSFHNSDTKVSAQETELSGRKERKAKEVILRRNTCSIASDDTQKSAGRRKGCWKQETERPGGDVRVQAGASWNRASSNQAHRLRGPRGCVTKPKSVPKCTLSTPGLPQGPQRQESTHNAGAAGDSGSIPGLGDPGEAAAAQRLRGQRTGVAGCRQWVL